MLMSMQSVALLSCLAVASVLQAASVRYANDGAAAIVPADAALLFTRQAFVPDASLAHHGVTVVLALAKAQRGEVVRIQLVGKSQEAVDTAKRAIRKHSPPGRCPPITAVVGALTERDAAVAIDVVAVRSGPASKPAARRSLLLISGQAEKGATPAQAAANTMSSLVQTLAFLGAEPSDVLQVRCFLNSVGAASQVTKEIEKALQPTKAPIVYVEWTSPDSLPLEIELIATGPAPGGADAPAVEYLTQPGATASPVFSRVTRVNRGDMIFIGGLYSSQAGDGRQQVLSIFKQIEKLVTANGSDMRHLVKATYYVSDDDASRQLNVLRPMFYDAKRPPAASKATVPGVGADARSISIDMIAVTAEATTP